MSEAEERRKYLEELVMRAITVGSDESEGMQTLDLSEVNLCNSDYVPTEEPEYSRDDIDSMLHDSDPEVTKKSRPDGTGGSDSGSGGGSGGPRGGTGGKPLVDGNPQENPDDLPGTDSASVGGKTASGGGSGGGNAGGGSGGGQGGSGGGNGSGGGDDRRTDAVADDGNPDGELHAVVEFAQPCVRDPRPVDFEIYVRPGQKLDKDTVVGRVTLDGVSKDVRSIFSSGVVRASADGRSLARLYSSAGCDRHFIVDGYELCGDAPDVDTGAIEAVKARFEKEAYLNQAITEFLDESILPWILLRRYKSWEYSDDVAATRIVRDNGRAIYAGYMKRVREMKERYVDDIQKIGTADNVRATKGNGPKLRALGQSAVDRRQKFADDVLYNYNEFKETLPLCEYDPDYSDCRFLAYGKKVKGGETSTSTLVGNTEYDNYYVALMSRIDPETVNPYLRRLREILEKIVDERMAREKYRRSDLQKEFDSLFKKIINKKYKNAFLKLDEAMKKLGQEPSIEDAEAWIRGCVRKKQKNAYTETSVSQLANIYLFFRSCEPSKLSEKPLPLPAGVSFVDESRSASEKLRWAEGTEFPYGEGAPEPRTLEDIPDGKYPVGPENGKYAVDAGGVTGWIKEKSGGTVVITVPKLTAEERDAVRDSRIAGVRDLVEEEWRKLSEFWDSVLAEYSSCKLDSAIAALKNLAGSVDHYARWPEPGQLSVGGETYEHYLFGNSPEPDGGDDDYEGGVDYETTPPDVPTEADPPDADLSDLADNDDDVQDGEPTVKDFKYWQRYFALATVISLPFLNCGLDIPPYVMNVQFPCIFVCVGVLYVQVLDIVFVFGISIRGMYVWPIVLLVNLSDQYANVATPLIAVLKNLQAKANVKINSLLEAPITSIANGMIGTLEAENRRLRSQNKQLETYMSQIDALRTENDWKVRRDVARALRSNANVGQHVVDPLNAENDSEPGGGAGI